MMMRELLERCVADITVRRSLKTIGGGELVASPGAGGLKYLFRRSTHLDPALLALAGRFVAPGAIVWDVGANVGLFSVAAASRAGHQGKVFAMEADLDVALLLQRTARLPANQRFAPISVLPMAVGQCTGVFSFAVAKRARASNSLRGFGASQAGGVAEIRLVPGMSLDDLRASIPAATVLKVDVEGAELLVLEGARRLLEDDRPIVLCEVSHQNAQSAAAFFKNAGYRIFDGDRIDTAPFPITTGLATWNTVALPLECALPVSE
jgi:FkbM family methyltransferase